MYDYNSPAPEHDQLLRVDPAGNTDPAARNSWGVDLNRNFSVGSFFDGYGGRASTTAPATRSPARASSPSPRPNEIWVQTTYPNIKFAMNIHSSGGYFMWPPGRVQADGARALPYPPYGTLNYF